MFSVEPLFIIEQANKWALSDRLKLKPYFDLLKRELNPQDLGGNLIIKEANKLPLTHNDFFIIIRNRDHFDIVKSILEKLDDIERRVYMRIIDGEYHIHVGKYYIAKWSFGNMSTPFQLAQLYLAMLDGVTDGAKMEAEQLTHLLLKDKVFAKPYFSKELKDLINHRDCAWIEGTNTIIVQNEETINDLVKATNGVLKEYPSKSVIKFGTNQYINIFKTAMKRTFPVYKTEKYIIASPLTSLYHLALDGDNPRAFDMIKHFQDQKIDVPFYKWGNTDYMPSVKHYFPRGKKY